jgi:hypothetical protein
MSKFETTQVPQANSLGMVCDIVALVDSGLSEKRDLAREVGIVAREIDYYQYAVQILGLGKVSGGRLSITERGRELLQVCTPEERLIVLKHAIQSSDLFKKLFQSCGTVHPPKDQIVEFLLKHSNLNRTTARRRANTMFAWLKIIE